MMVVDVFKAIRREWTALNVLLRVKGWLDPVSREPDVLAPDDLEACIDRFSDRTAVRFEGREMTYSELDSFANRIAQWALSKGLKRGETVALLMENCPEYIAVWFGLSKIGVVTALVNTNLSGDSLAHSIGIVNARLLITGSEQDEQVQTLPSSLLDTLPVWSLGGSFGHSLGEVLELKPDRRPAKSTRARMTSDATCLYIYTSGTTGLPKAAHMSHARVRTMIRTFIAPCKATSEDRTYVTLPLYHATGGLCAVGIAFQTGGEVVLRRRFSASAFWQDCRDHEVSIIAYIGELCRYLVNQPAQPGDRQHKVRAAFGNGLGSDIWNTFSDRFGVSRIVEFYGSTEGNVKFMNYDSQPGSCGRVPPIARKQYQHVAFVKFDPVTGTPVRDENGYCVRTGTNEVGEAIGRIGSDTTTRFEGYRDEEASEEKILKDVFEPGDRWFRTGDLMRQDKHGYVYFVDRAGDTFRWKGENVSTNQVADALARVPGVQTANVYGVPVPGSDGKAGMASVTTNGYLDYQHLLDSLAAHLPRYAIPVFIREQQEAATTGTFKYRKVDLAADGYDPDTVEDPVWYADPETGQYVRLTPEEYTKITAGGKHF
ncbi:long-chain-acyl-CoA synthetase [Henriciella sp.]|uniref:long-chain-acyl-CoA synthetase n=1 Tax=Henriciella sp. TaxID=1968823 RepID=UPI002632A3AC|nr:long-chain-acyl-CoA synthetase [Henriciella sp.]